jgi:L-alanine-DL-glutamate epimerase-like enolase superfamily enzyme
MGEGYTFLDRDYSVMHYVEELSNCIIGRDPFNIKSFTYFKDGYLYLPDRPGIGMEINEEFLLKSSYKHDQRRTIHEFF